MYILSCTYQISKFSLFILESFQFRNFKDLAVDETEYLTLKKLERDRETKEDVFKDK